MHAPEVDPNLNSAIQGRDRNQFIYSSYDI